ncbi:hypothetical protein KY325_01515, partial [Candidatus Woesearchaeota archaeon]|nr:hypothetical protein [Candidatus Woesearchaeota archaeon]
TAIAIKNFEKTLKQNSTSSKKKELENIVGAFEKVRSQNPQVFSEAQISKYLNDRADILKKLVDEYFVAAMSKEFPLLSNEIFEMKRYLAIEKKGKTYTIVEDLANEKSKRKRLTKIEMPLFAYVPLFKGNHKAELGKIVKTEQARDSWSSSYTTRRRTIKIYATLPGTIGPNLRQAYREALSHYHRTVADILENPSLGEVMTQNNLLSEPEVGAIWIPTPESLDLKVTEEIIERRPKDIDPAMILKLRGKNYLVKTWKVDDEEPFEHYLREYSIGDLKGKV